MNKKKIITLSIILLVLVLIALIGIIIYLKNKVNKEQQVEIGSTIVSEYGKIENNSISEVSYFDINTCVTDYLDKLNTKKSSYYKRDNSGKYILSVEENVIKKSIYDLLSSNYISKNNITIENVYEHVSILDKSVLFVPLEANIIEDSEITRFIVRGLVESLDLKVIEEITLIVNIDAVNCLYSIEPIKGKYDKISDINIEMVEERIEANENNKFSRYSISYETKVKDYINLYKRLAIGSPETMYNLLDKEYRDSRFGSIEEFKKYINKYRKNITGIRVEKYKVTEGDGYTQYLCIDQNNNYYIFREKGILNYSTILDTYTINLPEFIEKYDNSQNKIRVALNIEKLVDATQMGDYKYIYNKMNESFRKNNFGTVEKFEKFMEGKFDATTDTIEYEKYEEVTGVHVYNIVVTNKSENKTINAKVVMDLKENRDFEFSFSVEN